MLCSYNLKSFSLAFDFFLTLILTSFPDLLSCGGQCYKFSLNRKFLKVRDFISLYLVTFPIALFWYTVGHLT